MAKIYAIPAVEAVPSDYRDSGALVAWKYVEVIDIFGHKRIRRVSLGRSYHMPLETARDVVNKAREANNGDLCASFTLAL